MGDDHGYALNVDLDTAPFTGWITACGLEDAMFTTIARELGRPVTVDEVREPALEALAGSSGSSSRSSRPTGGCTPSSRRGEPRDPAVRTARGSPLPFEGCVGVEGIVLVREEGFFIAMLRFPEHATIHEHPGEVDTFVACIDGSGFTSVGGETAPIAAGQQVRWPTGVPHRLWTEATTMTTPMIERSA